MRCEENAFGHNSAADQALQAMEGGAVSKRRRGRFEKTCGRDVAGGDSEHLLGDGGPVQLGLAEGGIVL